MKKAVLLISLVLTMGGAFAEAQTKSLRHQGSAIGTVERVGMYAYNTVLLSLSGGVDTAFCSSSEKKWAFRAVDDASMAFYRTLVDAKRSGSTVYLLGNGQCDTRPDRETIIYVEVR